MYVDLSRNFVDDSISPIDFMTRFLAEFKNERRFFDERTGDVLNALFYAAEEFVDHPSTRPNVVGELQLRAAARNLLEFVKAQNDQ
ncbi:colicin immunity domain-containing protein [Actinoplanes sp. NPDC049265]|uniref:colicin immunity domain-containing protein n=1 Tax=Actinoplanes sp. NPDC049265 TaxID=3363902 RepID=UPI00371E703A